MSNAVIGTIRRFYLYQKERFPVLPLILGIVPATFSSSAVFSQNPDIVALTSAVAVSFLYLLHVRVIDELRDFEHDVLYHPSRPLQKGVITRRELRYVDLAAMVILLLIAFSAGIIATAVALAMLCYSYLAGKEFFVGEALRKRFFLYNGLNLVQMLLMQIFVYAIFAPNLPLSMLLLAHFLFTAVGTLVFEFVRKLKVPGEDGAGKDTYTYYLGFARAHSVYLFLLALNATLFTWIITLMAANTVWVILGAGCATVAFSAALVHRMQRTKRTDVLMQSSFVVLYGLFNFVIFAAKIYG